MLRSDSAVYDHCSRCRRLWSIRKPIDTKITQSRDAGCQTEIRLSGTCDFLLANVDMAVTCQVSKPGPPQRLS